MAERHVKPRVGGDAVEGRRRPRLPVELEGLHGHHPAPVRVAPHVAAVEDEARAPAVVLEPLAVEGDLGRGEHLVDVRQRVVGALAGGDDPAPGAGHQAELAEEPQPADGLQHVVLLPEVRAVFLRRVRPGAEEIIAGRPAVVPLRVERVALVVVLAHVHELEHVVALERERRHRVAALGEDPCLALAVLESGLGVEEGAVDVEGRAEEVRLPVAGPDRQLRAVVDRLEPRVEAEDVPVADRRPLRLLDEQELLLEPPLPVRLEPGAPGLALGDERREALGHLDPFRRRAGGAGRRGHRCGRLPPDRLVLPARRRAQKQPRGAPGRQDPC